MATLEKPTRGKPVIEGFYYLWASEKFFYSIFIFRKITQSYLSLLAQQKPLQNCPEKLLDFCPKNPYTVWLSQQ
jgi:hypothetical protein